MKKKFLTAGIFAALFIVLTISLCIFDVEAIGPESSKIGLSHFNNAVFTFFGTNKTWDKITDVLIAIAIVGALSLFAYVAYLAVKRKKADRNFIALFGLYTATGIFYLLFEKIIAINYRPILEDGKLAVSYPSTHTLLACVFMWSTAIMLGRFVEKRAVRRSLQAACIILSFIIAYGRIFAGMHWMTDVHGAFFLAAALVFCFWGFLGSKATVKR